MLASASLSCLQTVNKWATHSGRLQRDIIQLFHQIGGTEPLLQYGHGAKRLRIYLPATVRPINGCTVSQTVDAHSPVCPGGHIRGRFSEPLGGPVRAFIHRNKTALASREPKCLNYFHDALRINSQLLERRNTNRWESRTRETLAASHSQRWRAGPVEFPFDVHRKHARWTPDRQQASFGGPGPG